MTKEAEKAAYQKAIESAWVAYVDSGRLHDDSRVEVNSDQVMGEKWSSGFLAGYQAALTTLKTALADAIHSPAGVIVPSAEGILSNKELEAAEKRRVRTI